MEQPQDSDEDVPRLPRRDEPVPPPWFERPTERSADEGAESSGPRTLSWPRALGLLALVLVIIWIPIDFLNSYNAMDQAARTTLTLGFVWAVVLEALAIWGLIRMLTRR